MGSVETIDVTFDFRTDTPPGKDPDTFSPTLRRYHRLLWSKPLPDGRLFGIDEDLHHRSELGEFWLSSDTAIPNFAGSPLVLEQFPEVQREGLGPIAYTIGGRIVFPATRAGTEMTINSARAFLGRIKDRFDLTVECIRRYYLDQPSPLTDVLARYANFFGLFDDFAG